MSATLPARPLRCLALLCLFLLMLGATGVAMAQTAAQLQQLRGMSDSERQRLMRQAGISEDEALRMLGEGRRGDRRDDPSRRPLTDMDRVERDDDEYQRDRDFRPRDRREPVEEVFDISQRIHYGDRHGLEMFRRGLTGYQELYSIPVPGDYVIGPGDTFLVTLSGTETGQYQLQVQRDGWVDFPALGPVAVAGLTFEDARRVISDRVSREKIGVRASITLDQLKSIQVVVSGEVRNPGVYVVPSLVSVIQLINLAGGATDVGALRRVRLLRAGEQQDIDLYEFIIAGERSDVIGLLPGDRLHVAAVESAVKIAGAVRRPGVYEVLPGDTLESLLAMAGGPAPNATLRDAILRRYGEGGRQQVVGVDLTARQARGMRLEDGMLVRVPAASDHSERQITLEGEFTVPGPREWRPGLRLSALFRDMRSDVKLRRADLDQGYIVRTDPDTRAISFLAFSPRAVFRQPGSDDDLELREEDVVLLLPMPGIVPEPEPEQDREARPDDERRAQPRRRTDDMADGRQPRGFMGMDAAMNDRLFMPEPGRRLQVPHREGEQVRQGESSDRTAERREELRGKSRQELLEPYLERLRRQTRDGSAVPMFTIAGEVHAPGTYPITQNRTLRDALEAASGLLESADPNNAVVLRRDSFTGALSVFSVDLEALRRGTAEATLMPGDLLTIRRDSALADRLEVEITGEVASPGTYTVPAGATMSELLELAGGVTRRADLRSAVFSRARLREMEQELRTRYVAEIRKSLIDASVAGDTRSQASVEVLDLVDRLEDAISEESDGRLQVNLPRLAAGDMSADLELSDGDRLRIPAMTNAISVAGQVRSPGSFAYVPGMSVQAYLELAGGFSAYSDDDEVFILRGDGSVTPVGRRRSSMFAFGRQDDELQPGDRIVVPIDYSYINRWELAKEVVQFVYQTGIGLAAVVAALRR